MSSGSGAPEKRETVVEQRTTRAEALHQRLHEVWRNQPGLWGQLTAVNHSTIGLRFIVTGIAFLLVGGMLAMFLRLQLAWSDQQVLDHTLYNQLMTMHGTTMMFLFAVPVMEGFALYLIPKMIGARDVPYPRMTAFGYWCYLFGGLFLYSSFFFGAAPEGGWFMYTPLSGPEYSPGLGPDFWLLGVTFAEIAAVTASIELIVAILKTRAPGMAIQRMPLFAWYVLVTAFMIAFGFPPLILASLLLEIERAFGFAFFEVARGGSPLLWQHLFWLFGHPEVYIIFLPAAGVVSTLIPVFAQRSIVGYSWIVLAVIGTGFLSFGLWVHHMFAIGIPLLALSFFSAASMAVAIPMGVQVFAWIATLWAGKPQLRPPMRFILGFFLIFVLGGLTGVMVAVVPFDWQVHDTHFIVAHLHYVVIGGLLFPLLAGVYYWLPHLSGRMPHEGFSRMVFWLIFIGFNLTFLPMHFTGLLGMPRRAYTYSAEVGASVQWLNLISTAAGFLLAVGFVAFCIDIWLTIRHGRRAPRNPWRAPTLEWAMPTPPPVYNFASQPSIAGREPLWDRAELPAQLAEGQGFLPGAQRGTREMLGTSLRAGTPEQVITLSGSTPIPLLTALTLVVVLACFIAGWYAAAALAFTGTIAMLWWWIWTTGDGGAPLRIDAGSEGAQPLHLPTQSASADAPGWWGTVIFLLVDASLYASLVFAYFYLWLSAPAWPPAGHALPGLGWPALGLGLLLAGSAAVAAARRFNARDHGTTARACLLGAFVLMMGFLGTQALSLLEYGQTPQSHAYASLLWVLVGYQALHALVALLMAAFVWLRSRRGMTSAQRPLDFRVLTLFWHYTSGLWLLGVLLVHGFPRVA
jgi:cytochrome c oxidase subunit I+III